MTKLFLIVLRLACGNGDIATQLSPSRDFHPSHHSTVIHNDYDANDDVNPSGFTPNFGVAGRLEQYADQFTNVPMPAYLEGKLEIKDFTSLTGFQTELPDVDPESPRFKKVLQKSIRTVRLVTSAVKGLVVPQEFVPLVREVADLGVVAAQQGTESLNDVPSSFQGLLKDIKSELKAIAGLFRAVRSVRGKAVLNAEEIETLNHFINDATFVLSPMYIVSDQLAGEAEEYAKAALARLQAMAPRLSGAAISGIVIGCAAGILVVAGTVAGGIWYAQSRNEECD
ncbi:MAG: hypothetical protein KVP17_000268 [Porospora cf. gigantea B]|nr:MAG: hypothetical protein KVP17_000268 [Porospora cf. gigantea B]